MGSALTNSQELKLRLMTEGMTISSSAREALLEERSSQPLTLHDYASTSGLSMRLDGDVWVNAPISEYNENFVKGTPNQLVYNPISGFSIRSETLEVGAHPVPVPSYHDECIEDDGLYTDYAITHTDRVRISPIQGCGYTCQFCDLPYKRNKAKKGRVEPPYQKMPIAGLVESVRRALVDPWLPAKHVLISGGVPWDEDWDYLNYVYKTVSEGAKDVPVDVMMVPVPGRLDARKLRDWGIDGLSVNLELYNHDVARRIMPKKAKLSRDTWLRFIEEATESFPPGHVRSLLLVGLEPVEDTLAAVQVLAERGCDPVLSPFRPDPATPLRGRSPPSTQVLTEIYLRSVEIVEKYGVKLGPRCIPCMHNTLTFPDRSGAYYYTGEDDKSQMR